MNPKSRKGLLSVRVRAGLREVEPPTNGHATAKTLRTLDALQLAVAWDVNRRDSLNSVLAADNTLIEVAAAEGLPVANPET